MPFIIGIAGGTGSGKTVLAHTLAGLIDSKNVAIIQYDSYYKDRNHLPVPERAKVNYDHPDALDTELLIQHLRELIAGNPAEIPVYNFATHCRNAKRIIVHPVKVIILEGILLLAKAELREFLDIKVFVDVDPDMRFIHRLERDMMGRSRTIDSVIKQYIETSKPMHTKYVEPTKQYADIIISDVKNSTEINILINAIKAKI